MGHDSVVRLCLGRGVIGGGLTLESWQVLHHGQSASALLLGLALLALGMDLLVAALAATPPLYHRLHRVAGN